MKKIIIVLACCLTVSAVSAFGVYKHYQSTVQVKPIVKTPVPVETVAQFSKPVSQTDKKPSKPEFNAQYKKEVEKTLSIEIPKAYQKVDENVQEFMNLRDIVLVKGIDGEEFGRMVLIEELVIPSPVADVYSKLLKTTAKYFDVPNEVGTDWYGPIEDVILPYLKANNIDLTELKQLTDYAYNKANQCEKYVDELRKNNS